MAKAHWFNTYLKKHQFKLIVVGSILVIAVLYFLKDNDEHGTWSDSFFYDPDVMGTQVGKRRPQFARESKGEVECRRVLETLFMRPFPNQRPLFLRNHVTGKGLEIDCCSTDMMLGVEYNGRQHYEYTPGMHKNYEAFRNQQYRDEMKQRICTDNGFTLITVPYSIPVESIENYLREQLQSHGYRF